MSDVCFRYENRDMVYNHTTKKCVLSFDVGGDGSEAEVSDKTLIVLAIDALAALIEENGADPKTLINQVLKARILQ